MPRRFVSLFLLVCFLATATGAATLLHHHDAHSVSHQCQTCYLVKVAAVGLALSILIFSLVEIRQRSQHSAPIVIRARDRLTSAAPRAPPLA